MTTKYPNIEVKLTGTNGNALMSIGLVDQALRRNGVSKEERNVFRDAAMSGDYNNVLQTCMKWVTIS